MRVNKWQEINGWTYPVNPIMSECVCVHEAGCGQMGLWPQLSHASVLDPQPAHCAEIQPQ